MPLTSPVVKAESITAQMAPEVTAGTLAAANWQTIEPDAGGIELTPSYKTVARMPLSANRQLNAPQIVDLDATPTIKQGLTKDLFDLVADGVALCVPKHPDVTGFGAYLLPSAVTASGYTVTANFGLKIQNLLVRARGFVNAANNGIKVVGAGSTGTNVAVTGLTAETVSGYVATLEVTGYRGASGDLALDASGNLTSTTVDLTTLSLTPGQMIWVGGDVGSGHDFATATYRGFARVVSVVAHKITLTGQAWTPASADTGSGRTIDIYFGRYWRNVPFTSADYRERSYSIEMMLPALGGADKYVYGTGCMLSQLEIDLPGQNLVSASLSFVGRTVSDPTTSRATGAATGAAILANAAFNTVSGVLFRRISNASTGAVISDDIDNAKITIKNNVTPQKQHGTLGTARTVVGKCEVSAAVSVWLTQDDALKAMSGETNLALGYGLRNTDWGLFIDVPAVRVTKAPIKTPQNGPCSVDLELGAFQDPTTATTFGLNEFAYLPAA